MTVGFSGALRARKHWRRRTFPLFRAVSGEAAFSGMFLLDYSVTVDGVPRAIYVLSVSSNLVDWLPLATNLSPFNFTELLWNAPRRFFLGAPYTVKEGNLVVRSLTRNVVQLSVEAVPQAACLLERSNDLLNWTAVATNFAPFQVLVTNLFGVSEEFYRARLLEL